MANAESLYSQAVRNAQSHRFSNYDIEEFPYDHRETFFAMGCNGYFFSRRGEWFYSPEARTPFTAEFKGQKIAFCGPNQTEDFFSGQRLSPDLFFEILSEEAVKNTIRRYRGVDEDLTARISFLMGGIIRQMTAQGLSKEKVRNSVIYTSRMAMLGDTKSADALVSAISMYALSRGPLDENRQFNGQTYFMSEAVSQDPITPPKNTYDLGLSQVARMRAYADKMKWTEAKPFPDILNDLSAFEGFPTVGAEFHFPLSAVKEIPDLPKRLALLNMSQYQRGSYVQFSRKDRGVIEVRMNPSIYPVTIANWQHMRRILPELDQAFFTTTINRNELNSDFKWVEPSLVNSDVGLIRRLQALGMLTYAGMYTNVPRQEKDGEINFGSIYLGQTVRLDEGAGYKFTGNWGGAKGEYGQMGIYAGFGENFPQLAYYLSMTLANPWIIQAVPDNFLKNIKTLYDALNKDPQKRIAAFMHIDSRIEIDRRLKQAQESGKRIMGKIGTNTIPSSNQDLEI